MTRPRMAATAAGPKPSGAPFPDGGARRAVEAAFASDYDLLQKTQG